MKTYIVTIPVTVSVAVAFKSDETLTDEQAFELATDELPWNLDVKKGEDSEDTFDVSINNWEVHEWVVKGRVFTGVQNEYTVESEDW
jgi:hypothetical protein